uniref:F-box domain-containing protein n=1 Tax=Opuntia streptacantha TaxID=393608 RepID=A0A7C9EHW6_OPUST
MQSYSNLPEEIIIDVLSRLPAKSVGRCRCVSKPWRALLSRPKFIRAHLDRSRNLGQESLIFISESQHALFSVSLDSAQQVFDEITTLQPSSVLLITLTLGSGFMLPVMGWF